MVNALNNESVQGGILCDLTKVFDCAHHDTSLYILNFYQKLAKLMNESNHTLGIGTVPKCGGKHKNVEF